MTAAPLLCPLTLHTHRKTPIPIADVVTYASHPAAFGVDAVVHINGKPVVTVRLYCLHGELAHPAIPIAVFGNGQILRVSRTLSSLTPGKNMPRWMLEAAERIAFTAGEVPAYPSTAEAILPAWWAAIVDLVTAECDAARGILAEADAIFSTSIT